MNARASVWNPPWSIPWKPALNPSRTPDLQRLSLRLRRAKRVCPKWRLRALREAQVDARRMMDATETALAEDAALLAPDEIKIIRQAMFMVGEMLETDAPVEELRARTTALGAATDEFAARRMNASIRKALAGRTMDTLA